MCEVRALHRPGTACVVSYPSSRRRNASLTADTSGTISEGTASSGRRTPRPSMSIFSACAAARASPASVRRTTMGVTISVASVIKATTGRTTLMKKVEVARATRRHDTVPPEPVMIWRLPAGASIHFSRAVGRAPSPMFQPSRAWPIPSRAAPISAYSRGTLPCETECPSRSRTTNQKLGACPPLLHERGRIAHGDFPIRYRGRPPRAAHRSCHLPVRESGIRRSITLQPQTEQTAPASWLAPPPAGAPIAIERMLAARPS